MAARSHRLIRLSLSAMKMSCSNAAFLLGICLLVALASEAATAAALQKTTDSTAHSGATEAKAQNGWVLTLDADFKKQQELDLSTWSAMYPWSPQLINDELEYYMPDAFKFHPAGLDFVLDTTTVCPRPYSSGAMTTNNKWTQTYGYFEMRAILPQGQGFWPAFDPINGSAGGEIDIMEALGSPTAYMTFHCHSNDSLSHGSVAYTNQSLAAGFHTYSLQWAPGRLVWYIDHLNVSEVSNACVPDLPMYLLANVAIGGHWPGAPNASTPFPSAMTVDYIRAWQQSSSSNAAWLPGPGYGIPHAAREPAPAPAAGFMNVLMQPAHVHRGRETVMSVTVVAGPAGLPKNKLQVYLFTVPGGVQLAAPQAQLVNVEPSSSGNYSFTFPVSATAGLGWYQIELSIFDVHGKDLIYTAAAQYKVVQ